MNILTQTKIPSFTFIPNMRVEDPCAFYWLRQVTVRLRREIAWIWHEQGISPESQPDSLPLFQDKTVSTLHLQRNWMRKQQFFKTDPTANYLSDQLAEGLHEEMEDPRLPGSFSWVIHTLNLKQVDAFVLALGLIGVFDSSSGNVISGCLNDPTKTLPNLALAQRLWDQPEEVLVMSDPAHPLFSHGLLQISKQWLTDLKTDWEKPLSISALVAHQLLFPSSEMTNGLHYLNISETDQPMLTETAHLIASRLKQDAEKGMHFVPIQGPQGTPCHEIVLGICQIQKKATVQFKGDPNLLKSQAYFNALSTLCWLKGQDLFLNQDQVAVLMGEKEVLDLDQLPQLSIPITIFLGITERKQVSRLPANHLLPLIEAPKMSYYDRVELWTKGLGHKSSGLKQVVAECARRFRFQKNTIRNICQGLSNSPGMLTGGEIMAVSRTELSLDISDLAQRITPRFQDEELILPSKQARQYQEIVQAMRSLTEVHYIWGTERVWNENGISVLFSGLPGTGKTMGAEILAIQLDLPIYRIDLSQVASKYIGETEKNLKRLFDMADVSDTILFFDEADSLFGRRTEVRDAHDRYANLEISYLLERMERFKGLAILATNRKKDLDEAFLRRLRYIVDFPLPGEKERKRLWQQMIPKTVDYSDLDLDFLARQFTLAGGNIRSIIFNACLQSANGRDSSGETFRGRLAMEHVIVAIKREYEKLNRSISLDHFGKYATIIKEMEPGYA